MSRASLTVSLNTSPLSVYTNSLSLSPHHRKMLLEKKREFQDIIKTQKRDYDLEAQEFARKLTLKHNNSQDEAYRELRATQQHRLKDLQDRCQERLSQLFHRFQREWMENRTEGEVPVFYFPFNILLGNIGTDHQLPTSCHVLDSKQ